MQHQLILSHRSGFNLLYITAQVALASGSSCQQLYQRPRCKTAEVRTDNLALKLFTNGVLVSDFRKKNINLSKYSFCSRLAHLLWTSVVGTNKLTTATNYHIFLSFNIFEKLVSFMGGSSKCHVELISLQHTHQPPRQQYKPVCQTTASKFAKWSCNICVVAIKLYWDALWNSTLWKKPPKWICCETYTRFKDSVRISEYSGRLA